MLPINCISFVTFLLYLIPSLALLPTVPSLYIDKTTLGSAGGAIYPFSTSGYNFTYALRETVPNHVSFCLGLYNFDTGAWKMLSYVAEIRTINASSLGINLTPDILDSGIVQISFSIIVITQDSPSTELLTLRVTNVNQPSYPLTSSKFTFGGSNTPHMVYFIQWVTANDVSSSNFEAFWINYWAYVSVSSTPLAQDQLVVRLIRDDVAFMKGISVRVLLVDKTDLSIYQNTARGGSNGKTLGYNLGVDVDSYGDPLTDGRCIMGAHTLDLYFYRSGIHTNATNFLFVVSDSKIVDIRTSYVYEVRVQMSCLGKRVAGSNSGSQEQGQGSLGLGPIVGGVVGGVLMVALLVILAVLLTKYCLNGPQSGAAGMASADRLNILSSQVAAQGWYLKDFTTTELQQCSICLGVQTNIKTECGHSFHLPCILSWGNKMDSCPNCRKQIVSGKVHQLICERCFSKGREVDFWQMREIVRSESIKGVLLCGSCQNLKKSPET